MKTNDQTLRETEANLQSRDIIQWYESYFHWFDLLNRQQQLIRSADVEFSSEEVLFTHRPLVLRLNSTILEIL